MDVARIKENSWFSLMVGDKSQQLMEHDRILQTKQFVLDIFFDVPLQNKRQSTLFINTQMMGTALKSTYLISTTRDSGYGTVSQCRR